MKTYDRRPATRPDTARQRRQHPVQGAQLVVDRDPQRLKRACSRVDAPAASAPYASADQLGQLLGHFNGRLAPRLDNPLGDAPAEALLTKPVDQVCQVA